MIFKLATFDFQRVNPTNIPLKILWIHYKMSMFSQARVGQVNLISMQGWSKMRVWTLGKLSDWDPWRHFGPALHACPCCFYRSIGKLHTLRFRMATLPAGTRHLRWDVFFVAKNDVGNRKMTKDFRSYQQWFHFTSPNLHHQNGWWDPTEPRSDGS